jgi:hypothetical protein
VNLAKTSPAGREIEIFAAGFLKKGHLEPPVPGEREFFASGHPIAIQQHRIIQ